MSGSDSISMWLKIILAIVCIQHTIFPLLGYDEGTEVHRVARRQQLRCGRVAGKRLYLAKMVREDMSSGSGSDQGYVDWGLLNHLNFHEVGIVRTYVHVQVCRL